MEDLRKVVIMALVADFIAILFMTAGLSIDQSIVRIFMSAVALVLELCACLALFNNYKLSKQKIFIIEMIMTGILVVLSIMIMLG